MPTVNFIDPTALPGGVTSYGSQAIQDATEHLRTALRRNMALHITPSPYERTAGIAANYRKAAKLLGIAVRCRHRGTRSYHTLSGEKKDEACELYICITKAKTDPPSAPKPRVVDTLSRAPIVTPPARYEATVLPGVEVSR